MFYMPRTVKQVMPFFRWAIAGRNFSRMILGAIALFSSLLFLVTGPSPGVEEQAVAQAAPLTSPLVQAPRSATAASATGTKRFDSIFDAQANLIHKLRKFYGGDKGYRGAVAIFFLTIGPLKIIPAFLKLTAHADEALRKQLALRSFLIATISVVLATLFGQNLLVKYNIPLTAIVASGGIVLFLVALRIVLSQYGEGDTPEPPPEKPSLDLVVQPLVFPIILTPYGIAVVITLAAIAREVDGNLMALLGTLIAIMVLNFLSMLYARQILRVLKPQILQVVGLVLAVIQLSLGLGLVFSAVELQALVIKELLAI
jgi:multiple antibiotic resistance protein